MKRERKETRAALEAAAKRRKVSPPVLAERSLIASAMIDPDVVGTSAIEVAIEDFTVADHRAIWSAMLEANADGEPGDLVALSERLAAAELRHTAPQVFEFLTEFKLQTWEAQHPEVYADLVRAYGLDSRIRVRLRALADSEMAIEDIVDHCLDELPRMLERADSMEAVYSAGDLAKLTWDRAMSANEKRENGEALGIYTYIASLDAVIAPLEPGDLTTIGASTSIGKTALGGSILTSAAARGVPSAMITMEDSIRILGPRFVGAEASVPARNWKTGAFSADEVGRMEGAVTRMSGWPLWVVDCGAMDAHAVGRYMEMLVKRQGVRLIFVDYLQQIWTPGLYQTRAHELGYAVAHLKAKAKRLGAHLMIGSQLVKDADDRRPRISDLKETGDLANASENIILLWRDKRSDDLEQEMELIVAKNKQGPIRTVTATFRAPFVSVVDRMSSPDLYGGRS